MSKRVVRAAAVSLSLALPAVAPAINISWDEHVDEWSDPLKWSPQQVPTAVDSVRIGDALDGEDDHVDVDINAHAGALTISEMSVSQIADTVDILNGRSLTIHGGGILNDGHILLNSTGNTTTLSFSGDGPGGIPQVIAGRGEIVMGDSLNNYLTVSGGGTVVQHGNGFGHVIRGAGRLLNNSGGMINKEIIRAEGANALIIDPDANGFLNDNGGLHAAANSLLQLVNGVFTQVNFGAVTLLDPSAEVELNNATLVGGQIGGNGVFDPNSATLDGVFIGNQVSVQHGNGTTVNNKNGLALHGTWNLNGAGNTTTLHFQGDQTISGIGEIVMSDSLNNYITVSTDLLTVASDMTIRGAGRLMNNSGGVVNDGTILAQGSNPLIVDVDANDFDQNGVLRAEGAGGLRITGSTVNLDAAHGIDVLTGSKLEIVNSTINGGALNIGAGVQADLQSSTFDGVTFNGVVQHRNGITNNIKNDLAVNGIWNLEGAGNNTTLHFQGDQMITGGGEIVMTDSLTNYITVSTDLLTLDTGTTIRGAGRLMNNSGGVINNGTILATEANPLIVDVDSNAFDQNGVLRAEGTGGIHITGSTVNLDPVHGIDVLTGSQLEIVNSTINGGALNIGAGVQADLQSSTFDGVTFNGVVQHRNGITNNIKNDLVINGTWNLESSGNNTALQFQGDQMITGGGEIVMTDSLTNYITVSTKLLTLDAGTTIRGAGRLMNNTGGVVNNGTILATETNALIVDVDNNGFDQNGVLRAEGTGGIHITGSTVNLDPAHGIDVLAGSKLEIVNSTINGGALNIGAGVQADLQSSTFDGVTVNGVVKHRNGIGNNIKNDLIVNGTWNLESSGNNTTLQFQGDQMITGGGEIVMTDSLTNYITVSTDLLTLDTGTTIRGAGRLMNNTGGVVNNGTILATGNNQLIIDVDANDFDQNGVLRAEGAGGILITGSDIVLDPMHGIDVAAGSRLDVVNSDVIGGALNFDPGTEADLQSSTLHGVTINGTVRHRNGIGNNIRSGLTLNGTWRLENGGNFTSLSFQNGDQAITGSGEIETQDSLNAYITTGGHTLTLEQNVALRGAGRLLNNGGGLVNRGTIEANKLNNALIIDPNANGVLNEGNLLVTGNGGMVMQDGYVQTAGLTRVDTALTINNSVAGISGGVLGGSGTIFGDVAVSGSGTVNPGNSPGTLSIVGDYTQTGGTLLIEIAGGAVFDLLDVSGTATLGGALDVDLLDGYVPTVGQTFDVLLADTIALTFANGIVDAGSATFSISYIDDTRDIVRLTTVTAVPLPPGAWLLLSGVALLFGLRRVPRSR